MSKFFKALQQARRDHVPSNGTVVDRAELSAGASTVDVTEPARPSRRPIDSPHGVDDHLVSLVAPAAFEAEQYRALRHSIEHLQKAIDLKVVAVSSPGVGDGKSITAANLAGALAQAKDARVLLIDADLRRPSQGRLFGIGDTDGADLVGGILDHRLALDDIALARPPFNLSVICAGQCPPNPYDLLKSSRLGDLLEDARARYDYIIVDTPPLHPVQDCRVIGRWVDGFLVVVGADRTPRRLVEEALTALDPGKVLGLVFNGTRYASPRYSSGYYYLSGEPLTGEPVSSNGRSGALTRTWRRVGDSLTRRRSRGRLRSRER